MATTQLRENSKSVERVEKIGESEEKKSFDEENPSTVESLITCRNESSENSAIEPEDPRLSKFEELPDELKSLRDRVFDSQEELTNELERLVSVTST